MPKDRTLKIRDAKNRSTLPNKLRGMKLLSYYNGNLFLGSECGDEIFSDTLIFGYSIKENSIIGSVKLKEGAWPQSWAQKDNLLFVGTRFGSLTAIDTDNFREVGRLEKLENSVEAITVNENVYFSVNGQGLYKTDKELSKPIIEKRKNVLSALALRDNKLFAFYYSNERDPILDGGPAGGLVEVLNENLEVISKKHGTPYAVKQAINSPKGILFSTNYGEAEKSEGELYLLNPSNLSDRLLLELPAGVNILREGKGRNVLIGLKNGSVYEIEGNKKRNVFSQTNEVTGLVSNGNDVYVGSPTGRIHQIKYQ